QLDGNRLTVVVRMQTGSECVLHWGVSRRAGGAWLRPPDACWPEGSAAVDGHAVHTPLSFNDRGEREVAIRLDLPCPWKSLPFVVYFPHEKRWLKRGGGDFLIPLPRGQGGTPSPPEALEAWVQDSASTRQEFTLDGGAQLAAAVSASP